MSFSWPAANLFTHGLFTRSTNFVNKHHEGEDTKAFWRNCLATWTGKIKIATSVVSQACRSWRQFVNSILSSPCLTNHFRASKKSFFESFNSSSFVRRIWSRNFFQNPLREFLIDGERRRLMIWFQLTSAFETSHEYSDERRNWRWLTFADKISATISCAFRISKKSQTSQKFGCRVTFDDLKRSLERFFYEIVCNH